MARIADSKGRDDENSGYTRLLGLPQLGQLVSRIHATVIRNGNELEQMLAQLPVADLTITDPPIESIIAELFTQGTVNAPASATKP